MRPWGVLWLGFFLGREVELPHLSLLPKFHNPEQHSEPCGLEEDMVGRQFRSYSECQEDL